MKPKYLFRLIIYGMLLFIVGCSTSDQVGQVSTDNPDSTPQAELTPEPAQATLTPDEPQATLTPEAPSATPTPEASPVSANKEVQIRLVNISELDFDNVSVNFLGQEVDYGELASGQQSSYESVQEAYHYAWVKVEANGETYEMVPIDYIGETPLTAGLYSYALDIIGEQVQIAYFPDEEDNTMVDTELIDNDWYWVSAQKADNSHLFPMVYEEYPSIRFTQDPDPNVPGLHFEGYASCNWMGGAYHVNQYETLVVDEIGITERECDASESEAFFLEFLHGINYYSVESDYLLLFSWADGMMTFTRHDPASEPPYATDSYAALAPIVQAIASHARDLNVTRVSPSSDVQWMIDFFGETVNVYVFDDTMMGEEQAKNRFSSDHSERLWQNERFLISYDGEYDLIDDVLNELFGEPVTATASAKPDETPLDHPFELKLDQTATIASEGLVVRFEAVTEDSRCPADVECFWEGRVTVAGTISRQDELLHTFSLTLDGPSHRSTDESSQTFDAYSISLVDFQPEPLLEADLLRPEQTATFIVSLVASR